MSVQAEQWTVLNPRPRYGDGYLLDQGRQWNQRDRDFLRQFVEAGTSIDRASGALARAETTIAWRAREDGLVLPATWSKLITPEYVPKPRKPKQPKAVRARKLAKLRDVRVNLQYPYVVRMRDEHSDLMEVNRIVPRGIPGREDVCQELMLALWEKKITIEKLRANVSGFIRSVRKQNFELSGNAVSIYSSRTSNGDTGMLLDSFSNEDSIWART